MGQARRREASIKRTVERRVRFINLCMRLTRYDAKQINSFLAIRVKEGRL